MDFDTACDIYESRDLAKFDQASESILRNTEPLRNVDNIARLANAIAMSGDQLLFADQYTPRADVPSTGAPGSLSTLLCPILIAAQGVYVPKLSASGSVAGSIDSMALIPSFKDSLPRSEFKTALSKAHLAHSVQTSEFAPADASLIKARRKVGLMANPYLAAASLLGKKLVIPGTAAAFDFRIGPTGNIAQTFDEGRNAARIFYQVAKQLGVTISVVMTDNLTSPTTALGRLESLELLLAILQRRQLSTQDAKHTQACCVLAAEACHLVRPELSREQWLANVVSSIGSGQAFEALTRHLEAQGASISGLSELLQNDQRDSVELKADTDGYWIPPDLEATKQFLKSHQPRSTHPVAADEVGIKIHVSNGDKVTKGTTLITLRSPQLIGIESLPTWLSGRVSSTMTDIPSRDPEYIEPGH